jgi:hypothetical protein
MQRNTVSKRSNQAVTTGNNTAETNANVNSDPKNVNNNTSATGSSARTKPIVDSFSHNHGAIPSKTFKSSRWLGLALLFGVLGVYGYTMHQLTQEDFSNVTIPESIKQKQQQQKE